MSDRIDFNPAPNGRAGIKWIKENPKTLVADQEIKPKGKLVLDKVKIDQKSNIAIYVDVYLKDQAGTQFKLRASSFMFDLKPVDKRKRRTGLSKATLKGKPTLDCVMMGKSVRAQLERLDR
jgi:hypothetical protein